MPAAAVILTHTDRGYLGHAAGLGDRLAGQTVLNHTVRKAASIPDVDVVVLVHAGGQDPLARLDRGVTAGKPLITVDGPAGAIDLTDDDTAQWVAARKWSMTAWRGGLGFSSCLDELLPPVAVLAGLDAAERDSCYLLRGDWCAFDAALAQQQLARHLPSPEALKFVFTQAPPGLAGVAVHREAVEQLVEHRATFGRALGYQTHKPGLDPISREANLAIAPEVRDTPRRFIYDTPRSMQLIQRIADRLGDRFADASALDLAKACRGIEAERPDAAFTDSLPQLATLELTPRRPVAGPITPQGHVDFDRSDLDDRLAASVFDQLARTGDTAVMLGGLGDAALHAGYREIVQAARDAGVFGLGLETDLHLDRDEALSLLDLPLDVLSIRLNADTAATYEKVMGCDRFGPVGETIMALCQERVRRSERLEHPGPWLAIKLVKTADTLSDMESFFERWLRSGAMSIIEPACSGCGLMPELSPIPMAPPKREPCRQLGKRLSVLSDGRVAQCDQDWLGRGALGDATLEPLADIWAKQARLAQDHRNGRFTELTLCGHCSEWHRP